ncbi:MAG: hypothetical protein ACYS1C_07750 [Planctomycetota bacterium]
MGRSIALLRFCLHLARGDAMEGTASAAALLESYRSCQELLEALGHSADHETMADYLTEDAQWHDKVRGLLAEAVEGDANGQRVPAEAVGRMLELEGLLSEQISHLTAEILDVEEAPTDPHELKRELEGRAQAELDRLADAVLLSGHGRFLRRRYCSLSQFRSALQERDDQRRLALVKLVPFLREELRKRGYVLTDAQVRELFEPGADEREVPYCLKDIVRGINGEFGVGLIELEEMVGEEDPDQWLEKLRVRLQFRSHSAMHKAIAEATSLKYDCVHKALSGRNKAKRIQAEIKYCVNQWLDDLEKGRVLNIADDYRGVPVEKVHALLPQLERKFRTKEEIYRSISERTGVKTGSVRRYFQSNGQLKYAPLAVYDWACKLAGQNGHGNGRRKSYLADRLTRRAAKRLAQKANEALRRWRNGGEGPELAIAYKELRRALIMTVKEGAGATVPST